MTWTSIGSLQHWPNDTGDAPTLRVPMNGMCSIPLGAVLKASVYGTAKDVRPQVIKL